VLRKIITKIKKRLLNDMYTSNEKIMILNGRILSRQLKNITTVTSLSEVEFSIFSQFGDDGIIQWLIQNLDIPNKTFIEFGVGDFGESNTRFLMMNNNWSGFVMDGDEDNIQELKSQYYYWKHSLNSQAIFINKNNINDLIAAQNFHKDVGILHIDLDGNDYYIWDAISVIESIIVIVEYNSVFGKDRAISTIYDDGFVRTNAHYSNLLFGCSVKSLYLLAQTKGYSFIGCNDGGNNAYFVRNDKINDIVKSVNLEDGYVESKYRESRDENGNLTLLNKTEARNLLKGVEVYNTELNNIEFF
jgi:hypothetical protein